MTLGLKCQPTILVRIQSDLAGIHCLAAQQIGGRPGAGRALNLCALASNLMQTENLPSRSAAANQSKHVSSYLYHLASLPGAEGLVR